MREIKFRAFYKGKMVDGVQPSLNSTTPTVCLVPDDGMLIFEPTGAKRFYYEVQTDGIMQYTGLKDKNGKEIYEGDILKYNDGSDISHHKIFFDEKYGRWFDERLEDGDSQTSYDDFSFVTECKIVGNIYQNPEWL